MDRTLAVLVLLLLGIAPSAQARRPKADPPPNQETLRGANQRAERRLELWLRPMEMQRVNVGARGRVNSTRDESERAMGVSFGPPWIDRLDGPFSF
jgi:hypothetical protein